MTDKTCLSWWFPRLQDAGLPVPRTEIVRTDCELQNLLDGVRPEGLDEFWHALGGAANRIGYPLFLRTGHTSGKHRWKDTCYVSDPFRLQQNAVAIVEFSAIADFIGLRTADQRVGSAGTAADHAADDIATLWLHAGEFRCFVRDGEVVCRHAYWPRLSLEQGFPRKSTEAGLPMFDIDDEPECRELFYDLPPDFDAKYESLCHLSNIDAALVDLLASRAGAALGGAWSIDVLETADAWYVTDAAEAERSFHWDGCPNAELFISPENQC